MRHARQIYAQSSSRATSSIAQRCCYSQPQLQGTHLILRIPHVSTPVEITQKFMWTLPLSYKEDWRFSWRKPVLAGPKKASSSSSNFAVTTGHLHCSSMQTSGESWDFPQTVGFVRNSYGGGHWNCEDKEILGYLRESRAVIQRREQLAEKKLG